MTRASLRANSHTMMSNVPAERQMRGPPPTVIVQSSIRPKGGSRDPHRDHPAFSARYGSRSTACVGRSLANRFIQCAVGTTLPRRRSALTRATRKRVTG